MSVKRFVMIKDIIENGVKDILTNENLFEEDIVNILNDLYIENQYYEERLREVLEELFCKDRMLEDNGISIECCDKDE